MVRTPGNTLVKRTSRHSVRQQRRVAKVGKSSNTRHSKDQIPATHGRAAEVAVDLVVLRKEVEEEVVIAAEVVDRASEVDEVAAAVEAKEAGEVAVVGIGALMPMLVVKVTAEGAWSIRTTMRYPTGGKPWRFGSPCWRSFLALKLRRKHVGGVGFATSLDADGS
jgi:hypothetical protein